MDKRQTEEAKSVLVGLLGDTPTIRVLDFLLVEGKYFDYSLTDIANNAGVSKITLNKILPKLEELGIVKETRAVGQAKMYMLNKDSPLSKKLYNFAMDLAFKKADEEIRAPAVATTAAPSASRGKKAHHHKQLVPA